MGKTLQKINLNVIMICLLVSYVILKLLNIHNISVFLIICAFLMTKTSSITIKQFMFSPYSIPGSNSKLLAILFQSVCYFFLLIIYV